MTKILHSGDLHINLNKKKVPYEWQVNRFKLFFKELLLLEKTHDIHVIAGDIFDKKPSTDEITLFLYYINQVTIPTYIISGNHEATAKGKTFLEFFNRDSAITNPNVKIFTENAVEYFNSIPFQFFPFNEMQIGNQPAYITDSILVTHIRGAVPPNITAEYDFEKLRPWKLILLGDLHFFHSYQDYPAYYSGSPMNVSFDRSDDREYGVCTIDFNSIDDYKVTFVPMNLPKLIRKTISSTEEMEPHSFHHVIYEVEGSLDEIASVKQSDLLDKKIIKKPRDSSKIDLSGKTLPEELRAYLNHIKISNPEPIMDEFSGIPND